MQASPQLKHIEKEINGLKIEVKKLRRAVEPEELEVLRVSDEAAEKAAREYIALMKKLGKKTLEDSEMSEKLSLPIEQIYRVVNKLIKEGVVRERTDIERSE
jgi:predicted transcriptional regulator